MELAARIKRARRHADLTQKALAVKVRELTGMSCTQQNISKLEAGKSQETSLLPGIAKACGVRVDWLAFDSGPMLGGNDEADGGRFQQRFNRLAESDRTSILNIMDSILGQDRA